MLALIARANLALSVVLTAVSTVLSFVTVPLLLLSFGYFVVELQFGSGSFCSLVLDGNFLSHSQVSEREDVTDDLFPFSCDL